MLISLFLCYDGVHYDFGVTAIQWLVDLLFLVLVTMIKEMPPIRFLNDTSTAKLALLLNHWQQSKIIPQLEANVISARLLYPDQDLREGNMIAIRRAEVDRWPTMKCAYPHCTLETATHKCAKYVLNSVNCALSSSKDAKLRATCVLVFIRP